MKKRLLFLSTVLASFTYAQDCSDLFISEYVEGWSNNKALEIYNPTGNSIDLSQYMVVRYSNGGTTPTTQNAIQLVGTIAPFDVHVGVLEKLDPLGTGQEAPIWDSLQVRADEYYCPDYNTSNAWYWNGNDAIILYKGTVANIAGAEIIDVFGKVGEDPSDGNEYNGWSTEFPYVQTGVDVTTDHSLIRKSTVLAGQTSPVPSYFNPLDEYDSIPAVVDIGGQLYGNWFSLGEHECDCLVSVEEEWKESLSIYPNPSSNGFISIKGTQFVESIEVVDALGKVITTLNPKGVANVKFDLTAATGLYIVKFHGTDGTTISKRAIVK